MIFHPRGKNKLFNILDIVYKTFLARKIKKCFIFSIFQVKFAQFLNFFSEFQYFFKIFKKYRFIFLPFQILLRKHLLWFLAKIGCFSLKDHRKFKRAKKSLVFCPQNAVFIAEKTGYFLKENTCIFML